MIEWSFADSSANGVEHAHDFPDPPRPTRVFRINRAALPATLQDGTSGTLFFAERYRLCNGFPMQWAYGGNWDANPSFGFLPLPGGSPTDMFAPDLPLRLDSNGNVYGKVGLDATGFGTATVPVPFQAQPRPSDCDARLPQTPLSMRRSKQSKRVEHWSAGYVRLFVFSQHR